MLKNIRNFQTSQNLSSNLPQDQLVRLASFVLLLKNIDTRNKASIRTQEEDRLNKLLIRDMGNNGMEPYGSIIFDSRRHIYEAFSNGIHRVAQYTASLHPFEKYGPALIATYGYIDEAKQHVLVIND